MVLRRWGSNTQEFGFINGVDNVNCHRTGILKADVSSVGPSSERIEELWVVCSLYRGDGATRVGRLAYNSPFSDLPFIGYILSSLLQRIMMPCLACPQNCVNQIPDTWYSRTVTGVARATAKWRNHNAISNYVTVGFETKKQEIIPDLAEDEMKSIGRDCDCSSAPFLTTTTNCNCTKIYR